MASLVSSVTGADVTYAIVRFIDTLKRSNSTTKGASIVKRVNEFVMLLRKEGY